MTSDNRQEDSASLEGELRNKISEILLESHSEPEIVDQLTQLINRYAYDTAMEIIGNSDLAINGFPGLTNDNMSRNQLRTELRQAFAKEYGISE